ncbi:hypothetical protein O1R50_26070 [Glycomyces luteolus]|uniref:WXG100 family type VII secretion target n=1 Tax=Glycomyces luteolus TaxID=2670330 RepID=A0A9X3PG54_9ACTN|nr:hypothetical protein [Glycomyces luteolus]MDA1363107.1 hypothetical protein [Glycomyces luteolus]
MSDQSLIATTSDIAPESQRDGWTGMSFADDYKGIAQAIESGSWIDGAIAGLGATLNAVGTVLDPFGSLASMGVSWAIEQCDPLREALDWFAGDPEAIEVQACTWDNITAELAAIGDDLMGRLDSGELDSWEGMAGDAYRTMLSLNAECAYSVSGTAAAVGAATRGAGTVVTTVRDFVRDFVSECIGHVVAWLAEIVLTAGLATPIVAGQLAGAVIKWTGIIFGVVMGLIQSIETLNALLG